VGAGILYLPVTISLGGIWPLIFMSLFILPMTYLSHRALCRVILTTDRGDGGITEAVEEHFGKGAGFAITLIYFMAIYSICLVYAVGITNEFNSFFSNILHVEKLPRWFLSLVLIAGMTVVVLFGTTFMTRISSLLVFPLIALLFILALLGIPHWKTAAFHVVPDARHFIWAVLGGIPILVFAMNFAPVVSTFAVAYRKDIPDPGMLDRKTGRIIGFNSLMLFVFVLFFVFSV
jgi:serine transporter